jgi:hypothetical protein
VWRYGKAERRAVAVATLLVAVAACQRAHGDEGRAADQQRARDLATQACAGVKNASSESTADDRWSADQGYANALATPIRQAADAAELDPRWHTLAAAITGLRDVALQGSSDLPDEMEDVFQQVNRNCP